MFKTLYRCARTAARHENGPAARSRLAYLEHLSAGGATLHCLRANAGVLYRAAVYMNLDDTSPVERTAVEKAATEWAHRKFLNAMASSPEPTEKEFRYITCRRLRFARRLQEPAIERADPDLAVAEVHTMRGLESEGTSRRRFQTVLLTAFSAIAMVLAVIGVYGLLAFSVRQRSGEIGIRMALGSTRKGVLGLVLREGLMLFGAGLGIGIAASMGLTRLVSGFLYGVPAIDPVTYAMVPCLLLVGTVAACLVPGLRATRIDPMSALRTE